jgi:hypothetical protein
MRNTGSRLLPHPYRIICCIRRETAFRRERLAPACHRPNIGGLDKDQLPAFIAYAQAVIEAWQQTVDQLLAHTKKGAKVTAAAE